MYYWVLKRMKNNEISTSEKLSVSRMIRTIGCNHKPARSIVLGWSLVEAYTLTSLSRSHVRNGSRSAARMTTVRFVIEHVQITRWVRHVAAMLISRLRPVNLHYQTGDHVPLLRELSALSTLFSPSLPHDSPTSTVQPPRSTNLSNAQSYS